MNTKSFLNLVIISLLMVVFAFFSINFNFQNYNFESRGDVFLNSFTKNINDVTVISIESFDNNIDLINLTILSDHGARIKRTKDSDLPSIYAFRSDKTNYKEIKEKKILHKLFIQNLK